MPWEWLLIDRSSLIFRAYYGALASARVSRRDANAVGGFWTDWRGWSPTAGPGGW
jgi:hypothetical protein